MIKSFILFFLVYVFKQSEVKDTQWPLTDEDYTIKFVWTAFRHGARASNTVKNGKDLFNFDWDIDHGELTNVGIRQHFILGQLQRQRYSRFLSKTIQKGELYMLSTDFNRTIMSLMSHYQGLYEEGQSLTEEQRVIAIPPGITYESLPDKYKNSKYSLTDNISIQALHVIPDGKPYYEINKHKYCEGIPEMKDENPNGHLQNIKELLSKRSYEITNLFNITIDYSNLLNSRMDLFNLADGYISAYFESKNIKEKYFHNNKTEAENMLYDFTKFFSQDLTIGTYGEEEAYKARVTKSRLMRLVLKYIDYRTFNDTKDINGNEIYTNENPKMVIYSIHDRDLAEIMMLLKFSFNTELELIPFASYYNIELLSKTNASNKEEYYIRIIYNGKQVILLNLKEFKDTLSSSLISDEEIEKFCSPVTSFTFLQN